MTLAIILSAILVSYSFLAYIKHQINFEPKPVPVASSYIGKAYIVNDNSWTTNLSESHCTYHYGKNGRISLGGTSYQPTKIVCDIISEPFDITLHDRTLRKKFDQKMILVKDRVHDQIHTVLFRESWVQDFVIGSTIEGKKPSAMEKYLWNV